MNKGIILGGVVVVAALAISPQYIGTEVKQTIEHNTDEISKLPGYQLTISELEQNWFTTRATLTLNLDLGAMEVAQTKDQQSELVVPEITINLDINHGPLLLSQLGVVGVADWTATVEGQELREYLTWPADTPFYRIQGVTGLTGNSSYQDMFSAFTGKQNEHLSTLSFSGYVGSGEINSDEIRYHGRADSLILQSDEMNIDSQQLEISIEAQTDIASMLRGEFYNSDTLLSLNQLQFTNLQLAQEIVLDKFRLRAQSQLDSDNNTGDVSVNYYLANLTVPDFSARDLQLTAQAKQISLTFLKAYQQFTREFATMEPEQLAQEGQEFFLANLLTLLVPEPELNITSLKGTLPEGSFNGHLNSKLVNIDTLPDDIADMGFWIRHTLADAQLKMDNAVAERLAAEVMLNQLKSSVPPQQWDQAQMEQLASQQAPMMLENLTGQGLLSQTEDGYEAVFNLKDNQATLNGTAIPLPR